ncbi:Uncharacterized conserved protein, tellurite resistance protein B (TerB) family [Paracoccus alkenifer]|uniref:Uncharacterized conserved protein, tellurite resistance protein B (TerB) family n=1 Tax=Paracoccus alkenifer TaxID=65735 RepID=A0A1H6JDX8_9RHOB|nr:Uncharacterized conserved protein, tellurite resistance protein B (TerB) family [Paracoccus alkenifer]
MFRRLLPRLLGEDPAGPALSRDDAEVAVAALLVRLARADNHYGELERARIDALLSLRQPLSPDEIADRRAAAEMVEAEVSDTRRLTAAIRTRIARDQCAGIMVALWDLARTDGAETPWEIATVDRIALLLGIGTADGAQAGQQIDLTTGSET